MVSSTTMNLEVLVLGVAALTLLAVAFLLSRRLPLRVRGLLLVGCAALILLLAARTQLRSDLDALKDQTADHPVQRAMDGYVSSSECRACHSKQFESWHDAAPVRSVSPG